MAKVFVEGVPDITIRGGIVFVSSGDEETPLTICTPLEVFRVSHAAAGLALKEHDERSATVVEFRGKLHA